MPPNSDPRKPARQGGSRAASRLRRRRGQSARAGGRASGEEGEGEVLVVVEVVAESVLARRAQGMRPRAVAAEELVREDRLRPPRIATGGIPSVIGLSSAGE